MSGLFERTNDNIYNTNRKKMLRKDNDGKIISQKERKKKSHHTDCTPMTLINKMIGNFKIF